MSDEHKDEALYYFNPNVKPNSGWKPAVGRIVHYTSLGDSEGKFPSELHAAMVTRINSDGTVALKVFYTTGVFDMLKVERTDEAAGSEAARGRWSVPERF